MKIVHTEASCGWGGQEIRILEEARGMMGRGHELTVLCPPESRIYAEASRFGVPVQALPIGRKRLPGFFAMRRWLAENQVDVINTHSSTDTWLTALACASLGRRAPALVRTRHVSVPVPGSRANRWLYGHASAHVATTGESLRLALIDSLGLNPARVTSVPTGIDGKRFTPAADRDAAKAALGLDPSVPIVGIVATLRSWKGHLYLLDALAALPQSEVRLVVVGDGPMRENLEVRMAELNLGDRVLLAGQRTDPERWLQAMDVFCLPSYANEGVPQAILQAMFCGLPIVTTPVGAIQEAVQDGRSALIVPPKDAMALSRAINEILNNPQMASRLGSAAHAEAISRFSIDAMLDRMELVFNQALA